MIEIKVHKYFRKRWRKRLRVNANEIRREKEIKARDEAIRAQERELAKLRETSLLVV